MPKKFDTNPLDPDFPEKAKAAVAASTEARDYAPPPSPFRTAEFPTAASSSITEEETRRFEGARLNSYAFQGGQFPAAYQPTNFTDLSAASERKVAKTGIPEKWLIGLPYLPYVGLFAGLIQLLVIPKEETKVRFHAAQGLAANVAVWIISTILGAAGNVNRIADVGDTIFTIFATIMLIIFAIRAWKGKPVHIESVDDLTNWLEEKIGPIKR